MEWLTLLDDVLGWDISSANLAEAMERARVLDYDLQKQLKAHMSKLKPRPSIYISDFIAANQTSRADNILKGSYLFDYTTFRVLRMREVQ